MKEKHMKKKANYIFILVIAVLISAYPLKSAFAQHEGYPYQIGGYFGIWGAYTINPSLSEDFCDGWDCHTDEIDLDVDESAVWGAKIGYNLPYMRALGLELEYGYMNPDLNFHDTTVGDIKFNNLMFNIYARIPVGIIHPYWGFGIGFSNYEISVKDSEGMDGEDDISYAWQLLTGVEIDLAPNLAIDIGYRFFTTELEFKNDTEGENNDIDYRTGMVNLGLKFRF
jgi:opacity protein-like surface antigen